MKAFSTPHSGNAGIQPAQWGSELGPVAETSEHADWEGAVLRVRTSSMFRSAWRLARFGLALGGALVRFAVSRRHRTLRGRAEWLQDSCRRVAAAIGLEIRTTGPAIAGGLVVSNHLGYLDIVAIGAMHPCTFLSKSEVRSWPVIGWATRAAGTLFVRRERRGDISQAARAIAERIAAGGSVMVFPEGTSSDGSRVLPFHAGVFESVAGTDVRVTPIRISYGLADGDPATEVCYWGDMTFVPHFLHLLRKQQIVVNVLVGKAFPADVDRKRLAQRSHKAVAALNPDSGATGVCEDMGVGVRN